MSRLQIRHLRLRVNTDRGEFGADIEFRSGLNVIEARNTRGKSICTQSIMYALGMEAMLGSRHEKPLQDAMHRELIDPAGNTAQVLDSRVWLEVEGAGGRTATIARWAEHPTIDRKLVSVWDGPLLTEGGEYEQHDHVVRAEGVLDREVGFHHFLSEFIGWSVPTILLNDGRMRPLYLEYLFPLFFVEQRGGWSGILAQQPNFFLPGAKERAIEYVLGIDAYVRERRRLELKQRRTSIHASWRNALTKMTTRVERAGLVVTGVPPALRPDWVLDHDAALVAVSTQRTLREEIGALRDSEQKARREIERPIEVTGNEEARLSATERDLLVLSAAATSLTHDVAQEEETQAALDRTMHGLADDLQRNRDAKRMRDFGSDAWSQPDQDCPTCHQPVDDVLLAVGDKPSMSLDDNIAYIRAELETFQLLAAESMRTLSLRRQDLQQHQQQLKDVRARIRAARTQSVAAAGTPSVTAIQESLIARARLDDLVEIEADFVEFVELLEGFCGDAAELDDELRNTSSDELTAAEQQRLSQLRSLVVEQLGEYGFISFPANEVGISEVTFQPMRGASRIGFGISASDGIRLVWAYLLGLLEVAREHETHHLGLVVFDEPGQQSADRASLDAFLARASSAETYDQQVIVATSEDPHALATALDRVGHHLIHLPGRLLTPRAEL